MLPIRTSVTGYGPPAMVIALILVNVLIFVYQMLLDRGDFLRLILHYGLVPAVYTDPGYRPESLFGYLLPPLTSAFLHGNWLHVGINMWTLWLFGRPLEQRLGPARFLVFYLACAFAAAAAHVMINADSPVPMIGASGAVAGVLGGFTLLWPRARLLLLIPILFIPLTFTWPAMTYTIIWFLIDFAIGLGEIGSGIGQGGGVARWAHIGGLLAGLALVRPLSYHQRPARLIGGADREYMREIGHQRPPMARKLGSVPRTRARLPRLTMRLPAAGSAVPRPWRPQTPPEKPKQEEEAPKRRRGSVPPSGPHRSS
ncbi:rhomboid family intramembrane serine protease [Telmatospirillum sp. J64-1]|uniref:rhomboid family intramembrane serine protease n=1 Tax=Telmatospirillum sp. J64-1 TaxID=2502183 RepID=UPI00115E3480|nr:rhomboid family intramembrane serine protease [Telmatospirillum sp. J64-1]